VTSDQTRPDQWLEVFNSLLRNAGPLLIRARTSPLTVPFFNQLQLMITTQEERNGTVSIWIRLLTQTSTPKASWHVRDFYELYATALFVANFLEPMSPWSLASYRRNRYDAFYED
jgi:hypothetical protein